MDWHIWVGVSAGLLQVGATIPYIHSMLRGTTRPNIVSCFLWMLSISIAFAAQLSAGASWSLFLLFGALICNVITFVLSVSGYGYNQFQLVDGTTLVLALSALLGWVLSSDPLVALILAVLADCVAYAPTLKKAFEKPSSELKFYWGALVVADILALVSLRTLEPQNLIAPLAYGVMNVGVLLILTTRRKITAEVDLTEVNRLKDLLPPGVDIRDALAVANGLGTVDKIYPPHLLEAIKRTTA